MRELYRRAGCFGDIRVFERLEDGIRLYCIDDSIQTMVGPDGSSLLGYVHAIKKLLQDAADVLLIGGAGGSLATMLARRRRNVVVVDIDPASETIARRHFDLDPSVAWVIADARTYIANCTARFDAVVMDACDSIGTRRELTEPPALLAMFGAMRPGGSLLINLADANAAPVYGWDLARAMASIGYYATLLRPEDGWEGNEILHISTDKHACALNLDDITDRPKEVWPYLMSLRPIVAAPDFMTKSKAYDQ